jgi:amino acid adenylation domain-containing protein
MNEIERRLAGLSPAKRALLELRLARRRQVSSSAQAIPRRSGGGELPLSFSQECIWLHCRRVPGSVVCNRPTNLRLRGPLQIEALRHALADIATRHESMRTTVREAGGTPWLSIHPHVSWEMPPADLSRETGPQQRAEQMAREEACRPFDLERGPLWRSRLLRIGPEDHLLLLTFHHFTFDAWSQAVLLDELARGYEARVQGECRPPEALSIQYGDYAAWDRSPRRLEAIEASRSYWRQELADLPALQLPTDFPRSAEPSEEAGSVVFVLPGDLATRLRALADAEQATLFAALLAAFSILLCRYTGGDDVVVGCPVAGRDRLETERLIGVFINTLPLRVRFAAGDTFREMLRRAGDCVVRGLERREVPLQWITEDAAAANSRSDAPPFQAMLIHERLPVQPHTAAGVTFAPSDVGPAATSVDIALELTESAAEIGGRLTYRRALWKQATMERMAGHLATLLAAAAADPDQSVGRLPLMPECERQQLLIEWNETAVEFPRHKCVHECIEEQAARTPNAVAVAIEDRRLSYRELNEQANQLAHYLRGLGMGPDRLAVVCLERSLELVVAILGVLKAGGGYLPLDTDTPVERVALILEDARVDCIVTQEALRNRFPDAGSRVIDLRSQAEAIAAQARDNPCSGAAPDDLAYVMYTSGSTGMPKGALLPHWAIFNHMAWFLKEFSLDARDNVLQKTPISFDASVWEFLAPLMCGARLTLALPGVQRVPAELVATAGRQRITVLQVGPSLLRVLVDEPAFAGLEDLRILFSGGEELTVADQLRLFATLPHVRLVNLYGPTETCIESAWWECEAEWNDSRVPIGRPIANTQVYALDAFRQPVPVGIPGELYIGGAGLARGYLNRPELTAERFVPNPFGDARDSRLYKTGDLVRWRADGNLEFLGRIDHQVKLRGYRIEPGEIEAALNLHPGISRSAVVVRGDVAGSERLAAFCVAANPLAPPPAVELRAFVKHKLPEYMIPSAFSMLEQLPLTAHGKVDRGKLRTMPLTAERGRRVTPPGDSLQLMIAGVWEELLGIEQVGIHDDLFELGGHSLLAVRMLSRVEGLCGRKIPVAALFAEPTVLALSRALLAAERDALDRPLVEVQRGSGRRPLFYLHGDFNGGGFYCRGLAQHLGREQPFYAIHPHGMARQSVPATIEEMAAEHLQLLRAWQPKGPYLLGGFCNGALVAFEIAQRLHAAGEQVDLLVMLAIARPRRSWLSLALNVVKRRLLRGLFPLLGSRPLERRFPNLRRVALLWVYGAACRSYVCQPYAGRIAVLQPEDDVRHLADPSRGWKDVAGEVDVHLIPGGHSTAISKHPDQVAAILGRCLGKAQA